MIRPTVRAPRWRWQTLIDEKDRQWLDGDQSLYFNRIMDLAQPVEDNDAATKKYVDESQAEGITGVPGNIARIASDGNGLEDSNVGFSDLTPYGTIDGDPVTVAGKSDTDVLAWDAVAREWSPAPALLGVVPVSGKLPVEVYNCNTLDRYGFESLETDDWELVTAPEDIVVACGNSSGSGYLKISKGLGVPLGSTTYLLSKFTIMPPFKIGFGASMSQRIAQQSLSIEVVGVDALGAITVIGSIFAPVSIASIQQATTTLTVTTTTPHLLYPGDHINIYGVTDSRLNIPEAIVANVLSPTVFTVLVTAYSTLTSISVGPFAEGFIQKMDIFNDAANAYGLFWVATTTANLKYAVRSNYGAFAESAATSFGTACSVATVGNASQYCDSLLPSFSFEIRFKQEGIFSRAIAQDALTASTGNLKKSRLCPDPYIAYKIRIKATNMVDKTRPVAKILTVSKNGTTTATITTDVPHGLTAGDQVQIYGVRDQTNFANVTTALVVTTILSPTTFTIVIAGVATATSYGGAVVRVTSSALTSPIVQSIQSISRTGGLMTIVGSATWAGIAVADTIHLYGVVDMSGVALPYDGAYKVAAFATSNLVVYSPGDDFVSVNCGGAIFKRTDFHLHYLRIIDFNRFIADIDSGNGIVDIQESVPVNVLASTSLAVTATGVAGAAAHDAAISGSPVRLAGRALSANYTTVATGDTADLITSLVGALVVRANSIPQNSISASITVTDAADNVLFASAGAGLINYITSMQLQNVSADTDTTVTLRDGTTIKLTLYLPKAMPTPIVINFTDPILMTAATAVNIRNGTTGATVYVNAQGYKAP